MACYVKFLVRSRTGESREFRASTRTQPILRRRKRTNRRDCASGRKARTARAAAQISSANGFAERGRRAGGMRSPKARERAP